MKHDAGRTPGDTVAFQIRQGVEEIDRDACQDLAHKLDVPYILANLLCQKGLKTEQEAIGFLYPRLSGLPSPLQMKGMEDAIALVIKAFKERIPVVIHGDYDVDGKSATVLLSDFLKSLDIDAICYLPSRLRDGYGLNCNALENLSKRVALPALLITVDCGITAREEVEFAKKTGFHVLITDHHEPPELLPEADAIINPKRKDCPFPFKELSGVGVVFYLIMGIRQYLTTEGFWTKDTAPNLKRYLDLVALGTIADVVPLIGVNRILVKGGLEVLKERSRPGLWALCEKASLKEGDITAEDVSYRLAPRLNAAGRIGNPELALGLLMCETTDKAMELAEHLEIVNQERRQLEAEATKSAIKQCDQYMKNEAKGLVVHGEYHPGVVGIVASRLVDKFHVPAIVLSRLAAEDEGILKGSGRSVPGINLYNILHKCVNELVQFGGHAMAAGLTIASNKVDVFREIFNVEIQNVWHESDQFVKDIQIDYYPNMNEIDDKKFKELYGRLGPFGSGNHEPVFLLDNLQIKNIGTVKNHLKFTIPCNGSRISGIGFGMSSYAELAKDPVKLAFKLKKSTYRGQSRWEAHALAIAPTS